MLEDQDSLESSRVLSWTKNRLDIPEKVLYGEDNPEENHRFGYLLDIDTQHSPENKARLKADVKAVAFSDVYDALEENEYREISGETTVTTSGMYETSPDVEELTEDIVSQIEKWGVDTRYDEVPPEGYEVMVSNPEGTE